jgi:hypothetical protein
MDASKIFCAWRTLQNKTVILNQRRVYNLINSFRLPTSGMGVFCKRRIESKQILGGPYTRKIEVVFLQISNQTGLCSRSGMYIEVEAYEPNGYNLYNMAGMFQNGQTLLTTLMLMNMFPNEPNVLDASNKRKFVCGSWRCCLFCQVQGFIC